MLEEAMFWYASLLHSLVEHEGHRDMKTAHKLSSRHEEEWRRQRKRTKRDAKQRLSQGERLADERANNKRKYDDMSAGEQQVLLEFDANTLKTQHDATKIHNMSFKGVLFVSWEATLCL